MPSPATRLVRMRTDTYERVRSLAAVDHRTIIDELDVLVERGADITERLPAEVR